MIESIPQNIFIKQKKELNYWILVHSFQE